MPRLWPPRRLLGGCLELRGNLQRSSWRQPERSGGRQCDGKRSCTERGARRRLHPWWSAEEVGELSRVKRAGTARVDPCTPITWPFRPQSAAGRRLRSPRWVQRWVQNPGLTWVPSPPGVASQVCYVRGATLWAMSGRSLTLGSVFVPGGLPTVTYVPRSQLNLENTVREFIAERHRILSISGPTKTGKTVLMRSVLKDAIWLAGGEIDSLEEFWESVADRLDLYTEEETAETSQDSQTHTTGGRGGIGFVDASHQASEGYTATRGDRRARRRSAASVAKESLRSNLHTLVIDDFHYIDAETQLKIVRNLKDLVFDGLPVILASVPHRAFDVVRVEREMTGRVEQLSVGFWQEEELLAIPTAGFAALNVSVDQTLSQHLAEECFSSPHLMQDFCLQLCKMNDVRGAQISSVPIDEPDWVEFFSARASNTSKSAFDLLARGPRQRTDRKERSLRSGTATDIYGAVLAAIATTGPLTKLTYEELRSSLKEVLASDLPQRHEVTRVLEEMAKIARERIEGEPVVDYDPELATLYISDPFFAYYLRWGATE